MIPIIRITGKAKEVFAIIRLLAAYYGDATLEDVIAKAWNYGRKVEPVEPVDFGRN